MTQYSQKSQSGLYPSLRVKTTIHQTQIASLVDIIAKPFLVQRSHVFSLRPLTPIFPIRPPTPIFPAIYDLAISYLSQPPGPPNTLLITYKDNIKAADTLVTLKSPQSPYLL
jgi:hypothetical protein